MKMKYMVAGFFLAAMFFGTNVNAQNHLLINLNNVSTSKGKIMLAVFNQSVGFPQDQQKAFKLQQIPAHKGQVLVDLGKLPKGTYAIAVFHDENNDGVLNTNVVGIPMEGFGFSNNPKPMFGAPAFGEASFKLSGKKQVALDLIY